MTEAQRTLTVTHRSHPAGPIVLHLDGELDYHTAPRLSRALDEITFSAGTDVILDVTELAYCDSTGLTVLISANQRAEAGGARFGIAGLSRDLRRVFTIVGLDQFFTLYASTEEAVEQLGR
ncbi:STAS domain-containing protein [Streptomyces sp. PLAI1-29]|uniref:Anti-sigma factor antagonist n=1 Tax=Streptomyces zingiberis TaxID=2053010 RepID=A0ABX1BYS6_9ACTN|nr:STAS domain-containing protein [Streptomyces zingiberis]